MKRRSEPEQLLDFSKWGSRLKGDRHPGTGLLDVRGWCLAFRDLRDRASSELVRVGFPEASWKVLNPYFERPRESTSAHKKRLKETNGRVLELFGDLESLQPGSEGERRSKLAWCYARIAAQANAIIQIPDLDLWARRKEIYDRLIHAFLAAGERREVMSSFRKFGGRQKAPYLNIPKTLIFEICGQLKEINLNTVLSRLKKLESDSYQKFIAGSPQVSSIEVNEEEKLVYFYLIAKPIKRRQLSFGRIRNLISEYRKNVKKKSHQLADVKPA